MKAVILAGGLGTRISEETHVRPKPMIEIGGKPILWHIMKHYSVHGINEFIICCGYKGYVIKEYFANYFLHMSDITFDMSNNSRSVHKRQAENWKVTLLDTGENTLTGGRLLKAREYVESDDAFCFTYGDGLSDIDVEAEIKFHNSHPKSATIAGVEPPGRYGAIDHFNEDVTGFREKPKGESGRINGGFFVLSPRVFEYLRGDVSWEGEPLSNLAAAGELKMFSHNGFWQPMDTLRDKNYLEDLWISGSAPWRTWIG